MITLWSSLSKQDIESLRQPVFDALEEIEPFSWQVIEASCQQEIEVFSLQGIKACSQQEIEALILQGIEAYSQQGIKAWSQ